MGREVTQYAHTTFFILTLVLYIFCKFNFLAHSFRFHPFCRIFRLVAVGFISIFLTFPQVCQKKSTRIFGIQLCIVYVCLQSISFSRKYISNSWYQKGEKERGRSAPSNWKDGAVTAGITTHTHIQTDTEHSTSANTKNSNNCKCKKLLKCGNEVN